VISLAIFFDLIGYSVVTYTLWNYSQSQSFFVKRTFGGAKVQLNGNKTREMQKNKGYPPDSP
jgi:hypothetical protein